MDVLKEMSFSLPIAFYFLYIKPSKLHLPWISASNFLWNHLDVIHFWDKVISCEIWTSVNAYKRDSYILYIERNNIKLFKLYSIHKYIIEAVCDGIYEYLLLQNIISPFDFCCYYAFPEYRHLTITINNFTATPIIPSICHPRHLSV